MNIAWCQSRILYLPVVLSILVQIQTPALAQNSVSGDCRIFGPAFGDTIAITTTTRLAGAIHSLTWRDKEFIDSTDHGRQLQSASNFDVSSPFTPETFNPTEAGSRKDGAGPASTSRLLHQLHGTDWLQTTSQMAFWLQPGERSNGNLAKNQNALSNHLLTKRVQIGIPGFENVIRYQVTFSLPMDERHRLAQFEILTGYMPVEFREFYTLDVERNQLGKLDDGPGEQPLPIVFSTADKNYAMGAILNRGPKGPGWSGPGYGRFAFDRQRVTKWNVVMRKRSQLGVPPGEYSFEVLVAIGTLDQVSATLRQLALKIPIR